MIVRDVLAKLEARAPASTAEAWDNVGHLVGDPASKTDGAVVSIDLTEQALALAIRKKFRLIVIHHPCIFPNGPKGQGLSRLRADGSGTSSLIFRAIQAGVSVYATHTNFDRCALEVVTQVSRALGVQALGRLHELSSDEGRALTQLGVYIPLDYAERVRAAIFGAGAGQLGNYDQCGFGVLGEGTFRGMAGANPFLGTVGSLERVKEVRLEVLFPTGLTSQVMAALRSAHPYEEIAYNLYPVLQMPRTNGLVSGLGYGFWGEFAKPKLFSEVLKDVKRVFQVERFLLTDSQNKRSASARIKRIAFAAGKGGGFAASAASDSCELLITGEAGYHVALGAARQGLAVLELGHRESERFFLSTVSGWLSQCKLKSIILNEPTQKII